MLPDAAENILLFGQRLRALRERQKLTQSQLGEGFTTASMISQIERGKVVPSRQLLLKIMERLGVEAELFVTEKSNDGAVTALKQFYRLVSAHQFSQAIAIAKSHSREFSQMIDEDHVTAVLALCYERTNQLELAIEFTERRVFFALARQDDVEAVHFYYEIGSMCKRLGRMKLADMYWRRGIRLYERLPKRQPPPFVAKLYAAVARFARSQGNTLDAIGYYRKAVEKCDESFGSAFELAILLRELAFEQFSVGEYLSAADNAERAKALFLRVRSCRGENECKLLLARIHRLQGDAALCKQGLQEIVNQEEESALKPSSVSEVYLELCKACFDLGNVAAASEWIEKVVIEEASLSLACRTAIMLMNLEKAVPVKEESWIELGGVLERLSVTMTPSGVSQPEFRSMIELATILGCALPTKERARDLLHNIAKSISDHLQMRADVND